MFIIKWKNISPCCQHVFNLGIFLGYKFNYQVISVRREIFRYNRQREIIGYSQMMDQGKCQGGF